MTTSTILLSLVPVYLLAGWLTMVFDTAIGSHSSAEQRFAIFLLWPFMLGALFLVYIFRNLWVLLDNAATRLGNKLKRKDP